MQHVWHAISWKEIEGVFDTSLERGLSSSQVESQRERFGENVLSEQKPPSQFRIFLSHLKSPLTIILLIASGITLLIGHYTDTIIIMLSVFLIVGIGFFQERKTSDILASLKRIIKVKTYVLREGNEKEVDQSELVPGDVIIIRPGNKIPADIRLTEVHDLKINESSLTGEWLSVVKTPDPIEEDTTLADRKNMTYMGTVAEEGWGKGIVVATGKNTEFGRLASMVQTTKKERTPYQKKISELSKVIGLFVILAGFSIFIIGIVREIDPAVMFLTTVAVAVAATPEGLPVAISIILAIGMQRILQHQGLVRKITAAETLGSTSVICTDKTGTLTQALMQVSDVYTGTQELEGKPMKELYSNGKRVLPAHKVTEGRTTKELLAKDGASLHLFSLKIASLCSEAFIENPAEELGDWVVRGRPTDTALLLAGVQAGIHVREVDVIEKQEDRLLFNSFEKMSLNLRKLPKGGYVLYALGAPERIIEACSHIDDSAPNKKERIDEDVQKRLSHTLEHLTGKGERVVATAYKVFPRRPSYEHIIELAHDLRLVGFIGLHDPLRKEAKEVIGLCKKAGLRPIIVTGDYKSTAAAIAKKLGLPSEPYNILEGKDLEELSEDQLRKKLQDVSVFARVTPSQKLDIINMWQERGEIVAMTGDGVNDAPALRRANIGVALGSGTDVAKEAADLVLLDNNFSVIVSAVQEGRVIVDNIKKTTTFLLSLSFTEIILISGSIALGLPLPILPAQILWENLLQGAPQGVGLSFEPKEKGIMDRKPEKLQRTLFDRNMKAVIFGFGTFFSVLLFGLFIYLLNQDVPLDKVRTIIFASLVAATSLYTLSCKNLRQNIWEYNIFSNTKLLLIIGYSTALLLLAVYAPPIQALVQTVPLGIMDWGFILIFGFVSLAFIEALKFFMKRKLS